jgi:lipase
LTLYLHEWGEPGLPTLVCLHGVAGYGGRFRDVADRPGDRWRVVAPDLHGHGRSPSEPPWGIDAHLAAIAASVPTDAKLWVGHSFGGRLLAELAAREPECCERLVLLDPALQITPQVALDMAEMERADEPYESVEAAVQARYDSGRLPLAPRELVIEADRGQLEPGADGLLRYRYCKSAAITAWSILAAAPPPPARVPTLIVLGADSWIPLADHVEVSGRPG